MAKPAASSAASDIETASDIDTDPTHMQDVNMLHLVMRDVMRAEVVAFLEAWRKELRVDLLAIGKEFQAVSAIGSRDLGLRIDKIEDMIDKKLEKGGSVEKHCIPQKAFAGSSGDRSISVVQENQEARVHIGPSEGDALPKETLDKLHKVRLLRESSTAKSYTSANEYFLMVLTIVSTFYVGIDTAATLDAAVDNAPRPALYDILDMVLTGLFILNLLPRLYLEGRDFWTGPSKAWNVFDFTIIVSDIFCEYFGPIEPGVARILRLARLTRVSTIMRFSNLVNSVRMFTDSLRQAVPFLLWTMLVQLILIYGVAIMLTGNISAWLQDHEDDSRRAVLVEQHGTLAQSMFTLFKVLLGGTLWEASIMPLRYVGPLNGVIFVVWLVIARFLILMALMASVCAFFVNKAQDIQNEARISGFFGADALHELQAMLESRCANSKRMIPFDELDELLGEEKMESALQRLKVDKDVLLGLFYVLDIAGEDAVNIDNLLRCVPICNDEVDVITLKVETKRLSTMIMGLRQSVDEVLGLVDDSQKGTRTSPLGSLSP